jgi:hypothetical protein
MALTFRNPQQFRGVRAGESILTSGAPRNGRKPEFEQEVTEITEKAKVVGLPTSVTSVSSC